MTSDTSNVTHQPPASTKRTKPVHQKRKGISTTVSTIPHPNASVLHTPLDLQPIRDLFNPDNADDAVSISGNGRHFSPSDQLNADFLSFTPTFSHPRGAHKRSARGALESSSTKRLKRSAGLLHSDIDIVSSDASPMFAPSILSGSLPPATQPVVSVPQ